MCCPDPDVPAVGIITASLTHANVTWRPSSSDVENPGSEFYVEFRKGGETWLLSLLLQIADRLIVSLIA